MFRKKKGRQHNDLSENHRMIDNLCTTNLLIPPSDLFEVVDPPDMCPNYESCLDLVTEGTYIAVIKRKEVTRLDPKYMISMAEARGLFGRPDGTPKTKQSGQTARAKAALAALQAKTDAMAEKSKTKVKVEMDRIAAPTRASLLRDVKPVESKDCPRHTTHQAHDGTPSYRYMVNSIKDIRIYLSKQEEEDLIRRLYTNSKINTFPARLHEDLPPLKFWNSPASVIETYLQRKVFQRRLQLAYEFNQSKCTSSNSPNEDETETQKRLTKAMVQLTADMNLFQHLSSQQVVMQAREREVELEQGKDEYQNKMYWDKISPTQFESHTLNEDTSPEAEKETESKIPCGNILYKKRQYFDHKNFYRLKNLTSDFKTSLAKTIGQSYSNVTNICSPGSSNYRFSNSNGELKGMNKPKNVSKKVVLRYGSKESFKHTGFREDLNASGRLAKLKYSSINSLRGTLDSPNYSELGSEELVPSMSSTSMANLGRKGTVATLRDSLTLAHRRISTVSKTSLPKKSKFDASRASLAVGHKNSYTLIYNRKLEKFNSEYSSLSQNSAVSQTANMKHTHSLRNIQNEEYSIVLNENKDVNILASEKLAKAKCNNSKSASCDTYSKNLTNSSYHDSTNTNQSQTLQQNKMDVFNSQRYSEFDNVSDTQFLNHKNSCEIVTKRIALRTDIQSVATQTK